MKHKLFVFFLLITLLIHSNSTAQDLQWVRQIGNQQTDEAEAIEVDNDGNSYFIGVAQSYTYDLDPTPYGSQIINNYSTPFSPFRDIYLIKLDTKGNFVWGKTFGDLKYGQYAHEIKIGTDGNIYLFLETSDFITANQRGSYYTIVKLSPNGNELSRIKIKNPGSFFTYNFDIDNQNNFIISGWFVNSKTIDFINTSVKFESQNNIGEYVLKLDNSGNFIWKKIFDYSGSNDIQIQTKPDGSIIAVLNNYDKGLYTCSISNLTCSNGNIIWEKKLYQQTVRTFHLDKTENIILAASNTVYQGNTDVDPSTNVVNTSSQKFLLWLDKNGNFLDVKEYFVPQFSTIFNMWKIESDAQNNVYLVGDFAGKIDADPSSNSFFLENPNGTIQYGSGYAIKFDSNRNFEKAYMFISNYRSLVKDLKVKNKSLYLLGDFNWNCDFDPGIGVKSLSSLNGGIVTTSDGFVLKLSPCDPSKPDGDENQLFCSSQNATISNLMPNFNEIQWYDNPTNGNLLSPSTSLQNGKIYYATQTSNSCETERLAVKVTITDTPDAPSKITNPVFCKKENATLDFIQMSGQNIKWYDTKISSSALPNTTVLENNKIYYASQTVGCESDRTAVLVSINDTELPTVNNNQSFCTNELASLENLKTQGTDIKYYDAVIGGNILAENTLLQSKTYYATQTLNGCESDRFAISVTIEEIQNPISDSPQSFCIQENAKISDIDIKGQNIKWYENNSTVSTISESSILNSGIIYASQTVGNCESDRIPIAINILEATNKDCIHLTEELPYPKFFTPNNDGHNDTWTIDFAYLAPNSSIKIFDRYGKFIKELRPDTSWDGTYLGQQGQSSDYWFAVTRLNGAEFRGHFTLKR